MGMGTYPDKVVELSSNFQQSVQHGKKAMVANKFPQIFATTCVPAPPSHHVAKAARAMWKTNMLVVQAHHHDEHDITDLIVTWSQQEFAQAPRSKVGCLPDWWSSDEEMTQAIKSSFKVVRDVDANNRSKLDP
jgi:hypothetical protein